MSIKTKIKKILVVDDNAKMAKCLADMVDYFGLPCHTACNGEEAIEMIKKDDYALVIADTNMPKVSGFSLLRYIKENYPKIPVAMISTKNSEATQGMVMRDMPDFYLPKPFKTSDIEELLSAI